MIEVFINVGLVPDSGSSYFLPKIIVGYAKAFEMCATGDKISAAEAKETGLVNKVVTGKLLMKSAETVAKNFASRPTKAIGMIKDLLNRSFESSLDEIWDMEGDHQEAAGNTERFQRRYCFLLEKRKPEFKEKVKRKVNFILNRIELRYV